MKQDELKHFGIKGMKWGVRRFQNSDGTLTAAGKKRYDDGSIGQTAKGSSKNQNGTTKSKHRQNLEEQYKKLGMTDKQAAEAADKRIRSEKIVAAAAGITVAACAAYAANQYIRSRTDQIIKAGDKLQRIESDKSGVLHDRFYASFGKHDNQRYAGLYAKQLNDSFRPSYKMELVANKDVKVASDKTAFKEFKKLFYNDPAFREAVKKEGALDVHGRNPVELGAIQTNGKMKKLYENFNTNLAGKTSESGKKFYDQMKKAGYDAIVDVNDKKRSGYNARSPLIVFNNSDGKIGVKNIELQSRGENAINYQKELLKTAMESTVKSTVKSAPMTAASAAGMTYLSKAKITAKDYQRYVDQYKKEHPNTNLTNRQIQQMFAKQLEANKKKYKK